MVQSDLYIIKNYIKKVEDIVTLNVDMPWLPQFKSYLKIIGIPFFLHNNSNKCLTPNDIETIIKQNQIFDNFYIKYSELIQKYVMGRFRQEQFLFSFSFIFWLYRNFVFVFVFFFFWTIKRHVTLQSHDMTS